jgi:hypothetical protein
MTRYERKIYRRVIIALLVAAAVVWYVAPVIDGAQKTVTKVNV